MSRHELSAPATGEKAPAAPAARGAPHGGLGAPTAGCGPAPPLGVPLPLPPALEAQRWRRSSSMSSSAVWLTAYGLRARRAWRETAAEEGCG